MFLLVSCTNLTAIDKNPTWWDYSDLIALDPSDSTNPEMDIIAVYTRQINDEIQIRLDFLDQGDNVSYDLHLAFDTIPGGNIQSYLKYQSDLKWETWIKIPSYGDIQVFTSEGNYKKEWGIQVFRDPENDSMVIKINRKALFGLHRARWEKPGFVFQVSTTEPNSNEIADATEIINTNSSPPKPVHVLFTFWNTLPGYSPSQVLRKWDGAHTGPFGGRHGLYNLLRTARSNQIQLILLDLKYPSTLAALDAFGGLETIRQMEEEDLLLLPLPLPDSRYSPLLLNQSILDTWIQNVENNVKSYGLKPSTSLFNPDAGSISQDGFPIVFQDIDEESRSSFIHGQINQIGNTKTISLTDLQNSRSDQQVDSEGMTLQIRQIMVSEAVSANHSHQADSDRILILGGELPGSSWGVPEVGRAAFEYIATHPWIKPVDLDLLKSIKTEIKQGGSPESNADYSHQVNSQNQYFPRGELESLLSAVKNLPDNTIAKAAVDSYDSFFYPVYPFNNKLVELRRNYIPNLWILVQAAYWAENPYEIITCERDIDRDGFCECLLLSKNVFAVIETEGGYLSFLFIKKTNQTHQIIGPSSQFITGTTDPAFWDINKGVRADPRVLLGAFEDQGITYKAEIGENSITLPSNSTKNNKSFRLLENGLEVKYSGMKTGDTLTTIPLATDPWIFFNNQGENVITYTKYPDSIEIKMPGGDLLQVSSSAEMEFETSLDKKDFFQRTENPNFDYPPGFYLPYPLSLINITNDLNISTTIRVLE